MIRRDWICIHCGKALPLNLRNDAWFCPAIAPAPVSKRRGAQAEEKEKTTRPRSACLLRWERPRNRIGVKSQCMKELQDKICKCPALADWYRLGILIGEVLWVYPAIDRPTRRFDGVDRQTPGFRVHPFEPPVVPIAGEYDASFHDFTGAYVKTPDGCSVFEVQPIMAIPVESGERYQDLRGKI